LHLGIGLRGEDARAGNHGLACHPDPDVGMGPQVLDPVRSRVFGHDVEPAFVLRKPDLDFAGLIGLAAARGEIEILLGL